MGVTATVPILRGAAVNQERSYASYPQSRQFHALVRQRARSVDCLDAGRLRSRIRVLAPLERMLQQQPRRPKRSGRI
jgi:hypothetical protein